MHGTGSVNADAKLTPTFALRPCARLLPDINLLQGTNPKLPEIMLSLSDSVTKRAILGLVALCSAVSLVVGQATGANSKSWSGTIVYSSCNADEAFAESRECMKAAPGAKLSLYDDTNRAMYDLEPQPLAAGHLGDSVTVRGTLDNSTIHASSIELMSIGLAVGERAPAFSARDQGGRIQTLDTLKGSKGTVLLFFRSADW